ncbi:MAG TPA: helix-turn-helix domain-containing protein [Mesotoga infera]|jgi:excisionase family DNA binding protein|nr:helix-turn-helix domain-containing protein [Mesotoga infera]HON27156.1 helix-turn-helix domain-containing protein [Mesotoga infera]HPD38769.1 helix-turn-helix domain-containing protein [Mesotoga infera]HRR43128.1 helix-turn-helix domain-containing protein [Mesotoga sp.]HRV00559.1 helix-turn-helix domain-containing protein [Mesotoga sp.]
MIEIKGNKYYDTKEVAEILDCTSWTIRKWINDGTLKAIKLGKRYFVDEWTIQKKLDWNAKGGEEMEESYTNRKKQSGKLTEIERRAAQFKVLPDGRYAILDAEGNRIGTLIKEENDPQLKEV